MHGFFPISSWHCNKISLCAYDLPNPLHRILHDSFFITSFFCTSKQLPFMTISWLTSANFASSFRVSIAFADFYGSLFLPAFRCPLKCITKDYLTLISCFLFLSKHSLPVSVISRHWKIQRRHNFFPRFIVLHHAKTCYFRAFFKETK